MDLLWRLYNYKRIRLLPHSISRIKTSVPHFPSCKGATGSQVRISRYINGSGKETDGLRVLAAE